MVKKGACTLLHNQTFEFWSTIKNSWAFSGWALFLISSLQKYYFVHEEKLSMDGMLSISTTKSQFLHSLSPIVSLHFPPQHLFCNLFPLPPIQQQKPLVPCSRSSHPPSMGHQGRKLQKHRTAPHHHQQYREHHSMARLSLWARPAIWVLVREPQWIPAVAGMQGETRLLRQIIAPDHMDLPGVWCMCICWEIL